MPNEHFPLELASVRHARRWVTSQVHGIDADVARLLVTELATNAVVHARTGFSVQVDESDAGVVVGVTDADPHTPHPAVPAPEDDGGRGLFLVAQLASRWGIRSSPPGKTVWFELPRE